jgi:hypothetical protein
MPWRRRTSSVAAIFTADHRSSDTVLPFLHYGGLPIFLPARNLHTLLNMRDLVAARPRPEDDI